MFSAHPGYRPSPANQAAARLRISRSVRSRLLSRRRRRSSTSVSVVGPSFRRPSSRSACLTQFRIACSEGSNSRARDPGLRPPLTSSTIRLFSSGGYRTLIPGIAGRISPGGHVPDPPPRSPVVLIHRAARFRFTRPRTRSAAWIRGRQHFPLRVRRVARIPVPVLVVQSRRLRGGSALQPVVIPAGRKT